MDSGHHIPKLIEYWRGRIVEMDYERLLDKAHQPTEADILETIGHTAAWLDLRQYIETRYGDWTPECKCFAKRYGWTIRYRKSGRTLCYLSPERGAFSVLIVLGKKEAEKALAMAEEFGPNARAVLEGTEQAYL
jgi:hypothetical protein